MNDNSNFLASLPGLRYSKDGLSVMVTMDTHMKKNGLYPVKIQVVHKRIQRFYPTGKDMTREDWKALEDTKSKKLIALRNDLKHSFERVESAAIKLINEGCFTFDSLNALLGKATSDTVNIAFKAKINSLEDEGRIGSQLYYSESIKSISAFGGDNIQFTDITVEWLRRYEKYMLTKGKAYTTIGMYIRALRAIMNEAKKVGIIKEQQYPFGKDKYEIPTGEGRKSALTLPQINKIASYTDGKETTERYRDLFYFSYLCNGINFADMLKLKYSNIVGEEIFFYRQKTIRTSKVKKEIQVAISSKMQVIIDRWGNPEKKPDNLIFPYLRGDETPTQEKTVIKEVTKRTNKRLKEIGKAVGIDGITTYTARHSYATLLKHEGIYIALISESLGHNDLKTTENYLASFGKDERKKIAALLIKSDNDTE